MGLQTFKQWADAVRKDDMPRARRIVGENNFQRATLEQQHRLVLDVREKIEEGLFAEAQALIQTSYFIQNLKDHFQERLRVAMEAIRQSEHPDVSQEPPRAQEAREMPFIEMTMVAEPPPVEPPLPPILESPEPIPQEEPSVPPIPESPEPDKPRRQAVARMRSSLPASDRIPEDSAWAENTHLFKLEDVLQLISPRVRKLIFLLSAKGARDYDFEELTQALEVQRPALRGMIMEARAFLEGLNLGSLTALTGKGYRYEQKGEADDSYQLFEALRILHPNDRKLAIRISQRANQLLKADDLRKELGATESVFRSSLMQFRTLLRSAKNNLGVLNESLDCSEMQLTTEANVPLEDLASLTLNESILWRSIAAHPDEIFSIDDLVKTLTAALPGKEFTADQLVPVVRRISAKVSRAAILHRSTGGYLFANSDAVPSAFLKKLTVDEYLLLKPLAGKLGVDIPASEYVSACVELRKMYGAPGTGKNVQGILHGLESKLSPCNQLVVRRRNNFLQSVQLLPPPPPDKPGLKKPAEAPSPTKSPAHDPIADFCKRHGAAVPALNDTDRDLLKTLVQAGESGMAEEALKTAAKIQSLKRSVALLNKGFLASIGKRIKSHEGTWKIVDGTKWTQND